jgi:transposase
MSKMSASEKTKIIKINLSRKQSRCPDCDEICKKHSVGERQLRDVGISTPTVLNVKYTKHYCSNCKKHFSLSMEHLAKKNGRFTNKVRRTAVDLVTSQSMTLEKATIYMNQRYHVLVPMTTLHDWVTEDKVGV